MVIDNGTTANTVGGTASGAANVISDNGLYGVFLYASGTSGNVVLGNLIGTDIHGAAALGNTFVGVFIGVFSGVDGPGANTVGGAVSGAANVISFNEYGVYLRGASGNVVLGNLIGTDSHGTARLGNTNAGVVFANGATANTLGGTTSGATSVIRLPTTTSACVSSASAPRATWCWAT